MLLSARCFSFIFLLNYPQLLPCLANHVHGAFNLAWIMGGSDSRSQTGKSLWNCRRSDRQHEYIVVLGLAGHSEGRIILSAQDGDNGGLGQHSVESHNFQVTDELLCGLIL